MSYDPILAKRRLRLQRRRRDLRDRFGADRFDRLLAAFARVDLAYVAAPGTPEAYEAEVMALLPRLAEQQGPEGLAEVLQQVFVENFDESFANPEFKYEALAEAVWTAWMG